MCGMAMAATGSANVDLTVLLMSVPVGLLTVAIVHANNTRDMTADRFVLDCYCTIYYSCGCGEVLVYCS
jgi:hypothetical protein